MGYNKASLVIPARFIATITHVIIAAIILMTREANIYGCGQSLAQTSLLYTDKDTQLTVALSVMIGLASIEIISIISGLSIYSNLQCFLSIAFHLAATISMLYFLFNRTCSDQIWPIFATCSCLPFFTELMTVIRICACRQLPVWL